MDTKILKTVNGLDLIIKNKKNTIILKINKLQDNKKYKNSFKFEKETFVELLKYIEKISNETWMNLYIREATSMASDYNEYYDSELDSEGSLEIYHNMLFIERPSLESTRIYKFNKRKMESFIYDLRKNIEKNNKKENDCI